VVLLIALVTGVAELISLMGVDSPFVIGSALGTVLGFAALAAALERALRFKEQPLARLSATARYVTVRNSKDAMDG
jgi:hypothetical protein